MADDRVVRPLAVGETATVPVDSRPRWVPTSIALNSGSTYRLSAIGAWTDKLSKYTCGPEGYESDSWILRWSECLRSSRRSRWFALIGAIGADSHTQFLIGDQLDLSPSASGELTCFANDVWFMRSNNYGSVQLKVTRVG